MKRPLFGVSVCFAAGVAVYELLPLPFLVFLCAFGFVIGCFQIRTRRRFLFFAVLVTAMLLGMCVLHQYNHRYVLHSQHYFDAEELCGTVTKVNTSGCIVRLDGKGRWFQFFAVVYTKVPCVVGEKIRVSGKTSCPKAAENDGQFSEEHYYRTEGILFAIEAEEITVVKEAGAIRTGLWKLRSHAKKQLVKIFSEDTVGFVTAVLLGDKSLLEDETYALYRDYGIAHVLAVSGMHIAILGGLLKRLFQKVFDGRKAGLLSSFVLILYGLLTGFSVSCIRAVFTYFLVCGAALWRRTSDPLTSIGFIGGLLLLWRPTLLFQTGYQLSFVSGLGMILFRMFVQQEKKVQKETWKTVLFLSAFMQSILLPLQLYYFYRFSPYGIVVNCMTALLLEVLFLFSVVALCMSFASIGVGTFFGGIAEAIVIVLTVLCRWISRLPYSLLCLGRPKRLAFVLYVIVLLIGIMFLRRKKRFGYVVLFAAFLCFIPIRGRGIELHALSVGQGDCNVILAGETVIVIDCGSTSRNSVGSKCLKSFLEYHGYSEVDYTFLSHGDADHTNGITELVDQGFSIGTLFVGTGSEGICEELLEKCPELSTELLNRGDRLRFPRKTKNPLDREESVSVEVLWPYKRSGDSNEDSLVLLVEYEGMYSAFLGDISAGTLKVICEELQERCCTLQYCKVPHHGSKGALYEQFYETVATGIVSVSVGENSYGHPADEVIQCLKQHCAYLGNTLLQGQISVCVRKDSVSVRGKR